MINPTYYEIREIQTGFMTYRGRSMTKASYKLVPGTCYGKGATPREAYDQVGREVAKFQKRGRGNN